MVKPLSKTTFCCFHKTSVQTLLFIMVLLLFSCVRDSGNNLKELATDDSINKELKKVEEIEEEIIELTRYQLAVRQLKTTISLPQKVVIQSNDEYYNKEALDFQGIIKINKDWFVLEYRTFDAEVENVYYFTFDYNGNQLDAELVYTDAIDLSGEVVFNTDSTFQVNIEIKEIEWVEDDIVELGEAKKDTAFYTILVNGSINKTVKTNNK